MEPSSPRHDLGDPPTTEDGRHFLSGQRRQAVVALVIGGCTIVAACLVGYLAHQVNREMFFRRVAKENLTIARIVANYIEEQPPTEDETARARSLEKIRGFWRRFDPPTSEAFLCVVNPEGELVICTGHTNKEGALVNEVPLSNLSLPGATTIGDLLSTKEDFYGEDATFVGERQLVGFSYSNTLDLGVMVHFPAAQVESEVAAASLPWSVGIGIVAGLLIPLSLGLLHRSYSSARRDALRSAAALRASEAEHSDLYNYSPDMYVSVDARTARILRCNQRLATTLGYAREDIVGRRVFDLYHPDSMEAATRTFDAFVETGEVSDAELQLKRSDGSPLDVSLNVSAVRDEHGTILFSRSCWRDITDRKRTENALRRLVEVSSREFGESFLESTALELARTLQADYTFIGELQRKERESIRSVASVADGKLVANCEYDLAGTPCENVVRKSVCSYPSGVAEAFPTDTLLQEMGVQGYVGVPLVDSQHAALGIVSALFRKPIDNPEFTESILQIYSSRIGSELERLRSDKALVESEERYRAIAEDMPVLICRYLPGGEITYVNEAYSKCFEKSADELVGQTFLSLIPEAERETVMANILALTIDSPTRSQEHQVISPGGEIRWQHWTNRALFDAEGRAVGYQSIGEDISERKRIEDAIREKDKQLDNLLSNVGVIVLEGDPFNIYYVGGQVERILGYPKELWFEDPDGPVGFWAKHLHPDDTHKIEICRSAIELGNDHAFEYRMVAADGREVWFYDTVTVESENGLPVKTRSVMVDITERKRTDEALRRSEERLDLAVRGTSDGLWDADLESGKEYWSPRYKEMLGYREDEIEATYEQFLALLHPEDKAELREAVRLHLEENQPYDHEFRMQTKSGKYCWVQSRGEALRDEKGRPYRMAGSIRDISTRKRIEVALQESEERLRLMMQESPSAIEVYDVNGLQVDVNKAYEDLWGFPASHTVNQFNVLESEQVEATGLMAYVMRAYAGEPVTVPEYEFDSRGQTEGRGRGRSRWLNTRIYPLMDSEGTVHHIVITHEDITDRKCAERERRALEAQLGQSQKMEAVGQLAGGVAHDFNNILTAIVGYTELSLRSVKAGLTDDSAVVSSLQEVEKAVFRAAALTRQLLVFSRHDVARPVVLNIHTSLTEMQQMLRRLIPEDIVLEVEGVADLGHVRADSGQIEQVIMNLVVNARDAMPDGGKVVLKAADVELDEAYAASHPDASVGPHVMLTVDDTGCGIEASVLGRVFEPFYTTKPSGSGTGLGLAMVRAIVERAGGHVTVDSEVGRGTSFRVYLPTVDAPIEEAQTIVATGLEHAGQETLLVCEDSAAVRNMIIQVLREAGYTVLGAHTPTQAIEFAEEIGQPLKLLVTDVVMPEMNGMKLSKTLTAVLPKLRTLFISGYTSEILGPHGVLSEGIELLEKPFGRKALLQRVRDMLEKPEKENE